MELPAPSAGDTAFRRAAHLAVRAIGVETIVLDPRRNRVYGLDVTGGHVLELLRNPMAPAELATRLAPSGTDPELAAALAAFLAQIADQGLIEPCAASPAAAAPAEPLTPPAADKPTPGAPPATSIVPPHLLWQEDLPSVTHQVSPPHLITNPQCLP